MLAFSAVTWFSLAALSFSGSVWGKPHEIDARRHNAVAARSDALGKRFSNARFTWYDDFSHYEVACGGWYTKYDHVVALNEAQFEGGKHCFKTVDITVDGKTLQAQIVDECPSPCPYGALDLASGFFTSFRPLGDGQIYGSWKFSDGSPKPDPTTSSSKWEPPTTTSPKPTPTTHSSSTHSSSTSISSTTTSKPPPSSSSTPRPSSSSASPSSTEPAIPTGFVGQLNLALGSIGALIVGGAELA